MNYQLTDFLLFSEEVYWQFLFEFGQQLDWLAWVWWIMLCIASVMTWYRRNIFFLNLTVIIAWFYLSMHFYLEVYVQLNPYATVLGYIGLIQLMLFAYVTLDNSNRPKKPPVWSCAVSALTPIAAQLISLPWQLALLGVAPQFTIAWTLLYCYEQKIKLWAVLPAIFLFVVEVLTLVAFYLK